MGIDVRRALLHWAAYSAEARNPLRLPAFCVRACRSLGGVRRSSSQIAIRIALTHSTPLPFPAQFACACSCLTLQAMAPKAYLTGKSKDKVAAKKTRKKPGGPRLRRCWAELHGWSFTRSCFWGWTLPQNQASLDWASSVLPRESRPPNGRSCQKLHAPAPGGSHCGTMQWIRYIRYGTAEHKQISCSARFQPVDSRRIQQILSDNLTTHRADTRQVPLAA